jgi:hypothetical protein
VDFVLAHSKPAIDGEFVSVKYGASPAKKKGSSNLMLWAATAIAAAGAIYLLGKKDKRKLM